VGDGMKNATECTHAKSVSVVALVDQAPGGGLVGKIVANYSDNPAGSVCTVSLYQFGQVVQTARAGGYGYDKMSDALSRLSWLDSTGAAHKLPYNDRAGFFAGLGVDYFEVL